MNKGAAAWRAGSEYDLKTAWVNFDGLMGDIQNDSDLGCMSLREDEPIPRVKARTIKLKSGMMDHYSQTLSCHTAWDWRYCDLYCSSVDCLGYVSVPDFDQAKTPIWECIWKLPKCKTWNWYKKQKRKLMKPCGFLNHYKVTQVCLNQERRITYWWIFLWLVTCCWAHCLLL